MWRLGLIVQLFRRSAQIQRKRMTMTVMAIAWGTIAIILLLSFGEGLKRSMEKSRRGLGENIAVVWNGETSKAFAGLPPGRPIRLRPEDVELIADNVPEISAATGEMTAWSTPISHGDVDLNKRITGVNTAYGGIRNHFPQAGGRFIDALDEADKRRVIFLGDTLAKDLFGAASPVGQTVMVRRVAFTVIGVMQPKLQMGTYGGPDTDHALIPLSTFQALWGRKTLSNVVFKVPDPALMEAAKRHFHEVLGAKYRFDPTDTRVFGIWDVVKGQVVMANMMLGIQLFLGLIGGLTLLIGGVGVANIMYAVVKHRTREIGVQMALGARRGTLMGSLVLEAIALTFMGGVTGIAVGGGLVYALAYGASKLKSQAVAFLGRPTFSLPIALATVALLGLIGLLAGYFPARRAASVQPAVALRHE